MSSQSLEVVGNGPILPSADDILFRDEKRFRLLERVAVKPDLFGVNTSLLDIESPDAFSDDMLFGALAHPLLGVEEGIGQLLNGGLMVQDLAAQLGKMEALSGGETWFTHLEREGLRAYGAFIFSVAARAHNNGIVRPTGVLEVAHSNGIGPDRSLFPRNGLQPGEIVRDLGYGRRPPTHAEVVELVKSYVNSRRRVISHAELGRQLRSCGFRGDNNRWEADLISDMGGMEEVNLLGGAVTFTGGESKDGLTTRDKIIEWADEIVQQNDGNLEVLNGQVLGYYLSQAIGRELPAIASHISLSDLKKEISRIHRDDGDSERSLNAGKSGRYRHIDFLLPPELALKYPSHDVAIEWGVEYMYQNGGDISSLTRSVLAKLAKAGKAPAPHHMRRRDDGRKSLFTSLDDFRLKVEQGYEMTYPASRLESRERRQQIAVRKFSGDERTRGITHHKASDELRDTSDMLRRAAFYKVALSVGATHVSAINYSAAQTVSALLHRLKSDRRITRQLDELDVELAAEETGVDDDIFWDDRRFSGLSLAQDALSDL